MRKPKAYIQMLGSIGMTYHNPILVSVGANDGITEDRVIPFCVKNGWKSILIEPIPHLMEKCKNNLRSYVANNKNIYFVQSAVGAKNGEIDIAYMDPSLPIDPISRSIEMGKASAVDGYKFNKKFQDYLRKINVPCRTLDDIIESKTDRATVVSIDVEGYEPNVFSGFDVKRWKPVCIIWEVKHLTKDQRRPIMRRLSDLGYNHVEFGPDCISALNGLEKLVNGT